MQKTARTKANSPLPKWLFYPAVGLGLIMHFGTALLRGRSFFPIPALTDFSAFFAAAYAVQHGLSPYGLSADWLTALQADMQIPGYPPVIYNPPLWPWLLQPLALLGYPFAAWLWVLCNLGLLIWVSFTVYKGVTVHVPHPIVTKPTSRKLYQAGLALFGLAVVVTFGPVFLDLSIGQTSILLLALCLMIGLQLRSRDSWKTAVITGIAIALATVAKLYPAAWLVPLVLLRRWKQFAISIFLTVAALGAGFLLMPDGNRAYWQHYLPQRLTSAASQVGMDDQSLVAWLDRLSLPHTYEVPGVSTRERENIQWEPLWELDPWQVQVVGYGLCIVLGIPILCHLVRSAQGQGEGKFYLWVLYILAVFPHMERYNHALLLPAMVWLWQKERKGLVLAVYILAGLSRLNHVWIRYLPVPWGPLASGFGLFAVIALQWGILGVLKQQRLEARRT